MTRALIPLLLLAGCTASRGHIVTHTEERCLIRNGVAVECRIERTTDEERDIGDLRIGAPFDLLLIGR